MGVVRYVPTYINRDGMRTLMGAAQGRETYATPEEAQAWLDAVTTTNSSTQLAAVFGDRPRFEVRPVECFPHHFDPKTIWFD